MSQAKPRPWSQGAVSQQEAMRLLGYKCRQSVRNRAKEGKIRATEEARPKYCRVSIEQYLASKEA